MREKEDSQNMLTFGGHLEVLRRMLFRILIVTGCFSVITFCFKDLTWQMLLAPSEDTFSTYRWIEKLAELIRPDFHFEHFHVDLITTNLSSQFMTHITTSIYILACLGLHLIYCMSCSDSFLPHSTRTKRSIPYRLSSLSICYSSWVC